MVELKPILLVFFLFRLSSAEVHEKFARNLRSPAEVLEFVRSGDPWGGEDLLIGGDGVLRMANAKSEFKFTDFLQTFMQFKTDQKVVLNVDSLEVLHALEGILKVEHSFIVLLFRTIWGPNGEPPVKIPSYLELGPLLENMTLGGVQFGLGFTSEPTGLLQEYSGANFVAMKFAMITKGFTTRTVLLELDIVLISNTDESVIPDDVALFDWILLRTRGSSNVEQLVNVMKIKYFITMGAGDKLLLDCSDELRYMILKGSGTGMSQDVAMTSLSVVLLVFLFLGDLN